MRLLNVLRGLYVRSPNFIKKPSSYLLRYLPIRLRFGRDFYRFQAMVAMSEVDSDFVRQYQNKVLREIAKDSFERSEFYNHMFKSVFGNKFDISSFGLDHLKYLPVLTKESLRQSIDSMLVYPRHKVDLVFTSGSSGEPFGFYLDRDRSVREWAFVTHIWGRIGYQFHHKRATLRGVHISSSRSWEYDPALRELRLSPFCLTEEKMSEYLQVIDRFRVNFLHGYPSAISILAMYALRTGWRPKQDFIGVLPISEPLFESQQELIKSAFGPIKILPFYGLSEKVAIAGALPNDLACFEFEPLYGITELVDDKEEPISELGREGRIVSTGLICRGMPLFRYDTGDRGVLEQVPERSNCYRLRIRNIRPRRDQEFLVGYKGNLISMAAINIHSLAYSHVREFQFYQERLGEVVLRVVPASTSQDGLMCFLSELQSKVGDNITFSLEIVDQISSNNRGKRKLVDQKLDLSQFWMG